MKKDSRSGPCNIKSNRYGLSDDFSNPDDFFDEDEYDDFSEDDVCCSFYYSSVL